MLYSLVNIGRPISGIIGSISLNFSPYDEDGDGLGLGEGLGLGDGEGEGLGEGLGDGLGEGLGDGDGLGEDEGLSLTEGLGDGLGLSEGDGEMDSDTDGLAYSSNWVVATIGAYSRAAREAVAIPPEGVVRSILYQFGVDGGEVSVLVEDG